MIFGRDMLLLIKHTVNWELICQRKQTHLNKYNISENIHRVDYNYKVGYEVILTKHNSYKYETPYTDPFVITHCWTNVMVSLHIGATEIGYHIRRINPYKSNTQV